MLVQSIIYGNRQSSKCRSVVRAFCIPVWTPQKCAQKTLWVKKVWVCCCALKYVSVHLMHFNSSWNSQRRFKTSLIHVKSNSRSTLLKKTCNYDRNILPDPPFLYFFVALKFNSDQKNCSCPCNLWAMSWDVRIKATCQVLRALALTPLPCTKIEMFLNNNSNNDRIIFKKNVPTCK